MSNYAAGPPGHGGCPPPGYPPPGYPPPGYGPPGYGPPGWGWKPGVIPLFSNSATRGLTLGDIFRGAVGYIRANPKATLGLTAAVVAVTSALARLVQFLGPSNDDNTGLAIFTLISAAATAFGTILLSGMLTVVVARAVFGSTITVGEAWRRIRGRLPALIGMGALQLAAVVALIGATVLVIVGVARAANGAVAALIGFPLVLILIAALGLLVHGAHIRTGGDCSGTKADPGRARAIFRPGAPSVLAHPGYSRAGRADRRRRRRIDLGSVHAWPD